MTTLAGGADTLMVIDGLGAAASFLSPESITYDGVGNLFISESSTGVALVRKLGLQTLAVKNRRRNQRPRRAARRASRQPEPAARSSGGARLRPRDQ